jgi:hypothetical protein
MSPRVDKRNAKKVLDISSKFDDSFTVVASTLDDSPIF